jgi:NAD-dependent SIR2 family protein deacetylase
MTKRWLSSARVREIKLTCSQCHSAFEMSVVDGDIETKTRYCLSCGSRLTVDVVAGQVTQAVPQTILEGQVLRQDLGRWILLCPRCNGELRSFFRSQDTAYGECSVDRALVRATLATPAGGAAADRTLATPSTAAGPRGR